MQDIFLIGGSPSSGSTLLVNLLNREDNVICLPETGLFAHGRNMTNMSADAKMDDLGWYLPWLKTDVKIAQALGWRGKDFLREVQRFTTAFDLIRGHIDSERNYWLVEKTPENIFAMRQFLEQAKEHRVVVTSRDALSVTQSLMRRSYTPIEGVLAWFAHSYESVRLMEDFPEQVYHCSYDHLTTKPGEVTSEIVQFLKLDARPPAIKKISEHITDAFHQEAASSSSMDDSDTAPPPQWSSTDNRPEAIKRLLDISSWRLRDSSWSRSPAANVEASRTVNLIGHEFDMIMSKVAFRTPAHHLLRPGDIEICLGSKEETLQEHPARRGNPVDLQPNSELISCLAEHYEPVILESRS